MWEKSKCPICYANAQRLYKFHDGYYLFQCPRCGKFAIDEDYVDLDLSRHLSPSERACLSGALWEGLLPKHDQYVSVTDDIINDFKGGQPPSFHSRADKLLQYYEKQNLMLGAWIDKSIEWLSAAWCDNDGELHELIGFLCETKRIQYTSSPARVKIIPDGWAHLETLRYVNVDRDQGFVAMWFSDDMKEIYDKAIFPAIDGAGYTPFRVDQGEHNGKIDDEIISQIRKSRFVLADFTGHRGGVYYEAGFAKGLGLEVIWTCRDDHLQDLHFDIRQYNCIVWNKDDLSSFQDKITKRIEAVMGEGRHKKYS